jgi:hypothetical protein
MTKLKKIGLIYETIAVKLLTPYSLSSFWTALSMRLYDSLLTRVLQHYSFLSYKQTSLRLFSQNPARQSPS